MKVRALDSFDHNGQRHADDVFDVSPHMAALMVHKGLVEALDKGGDQLPLDQPTGKEQPLSVSPVDQASVQKTSHASKRGGKRKAKSKELSS